MLQYVVNIVLFEDKYTYEGRMINLWTFVTILLFAYRFL